MYYVLNLIQNFVFVIVSSKSRVFRAGTIYVREMQIDWESRARQNLVIGTTDNKEVSFKFLPFKRFLLKGDYLDQQ